MAGCASITSVKTIITNSQGEIWTVQSKRDALVKLEKDGVKLEVDNRGQLGVVQSLLGVLIMKTDVKLSNKEGAK